MEKIRRWEHRAGALVRQARDEAGLTQSALADRCGVPAPVLSAIERGRRQPTLPTLLRILAACDATLQLAPIGPATIDWASAGPETHAAVLADLLALADAMPPRPHRDLAPVRLVSRSRD